MRSWIVPPTPIRVPFPVDAPAARAAIQRGLDHWQRPTTSHRDRWHFHGEVLQRRVTLNAVWGFGGPVPPGLTGAVNEKPDGTSEFSGDFKGGIRLPALAVGYLLVLLAMAALIRVLPGADGWGDVLPKLISPVIVLIGTGWFSIRRQRRISAAHGTAQDALRSWLEELARAAAPTGAASELT